MLMVQSLDRSIGECPTCGRYIEAFWNGANAPKPGRVRGCIGKDCYFKPASGWTDLMDVVQIVEMPR